MQEITGSFYTHIMSRKNYKQILNYFFYLRFLMSKVEKKMGFEKKAILILNDVAEIVLKWNLGDISEQQVLNKINDAFKK